MAWGKIEKKDLVDAGLDPDQIAALSTRLEKAASKEEIEEIKNTVTSTQNTLRELQTTLQTLAAQKNEHQNEDNGRQPTERQPQQPTGPVNIDPLEFMENPTVAVRKIMGEGLTPITLHTLNVAAQMSYNMAKQRLPHFEKFESEIKELWDKYTPQQKGKPDELIENLYNLVRGRHMDEIMTDTNKKEGKYNMIQSGGTSVLPGTSTGASRKPEDDLTPKELEVAARFGLTPEEWAKQKGGLKYV